jgi:excisionase family DNA binding protein
MEQTRKMVSRQEAAEILRCTPQTISNWVKKGTLKSHKINGRLFVDADTIDILKDTAFEMETARKEVEALRDDYLRQKQELETLVNAKREEIGLYKTSFISRITKDMIAAMLQSYGDCLPQREYETLCSLMKNGDLNYIADLLDLTPMRVMQIADRACKRIRFIRYDKVREENHVLRSKIRELEKMNEKLKLGIPVEPQVGNPLLEKHVIDCDFSVRALNVMRRLEIQTVGDLIKTKRIELLKCRNVGRKTLAEIEEFIETNGLENCAENVFSESKSHRHGIDLFR